MPGTRIAVATADLRRGLKASIPLAAATGADGVAFDLRNELQPAQLGDTAIRQLKHLVDEHGLRVATAYFPLRLPLFEAAHADERITAISAAMQLAWRLGAGGLAVPTGPLPVQQSKEEERLIESVNAIATAGNQIGVVPMLSFGLQSAARVKQLLDKIEAGPVMIDINPVDWLSDRPPETAAGKLRLGELTFSADDTSGDDAPQTLEGLIRALPQAIGHIQGRDGRWVGRGTHVETLIGTGQVDWPFLLALLDEAAYAGWITVRREGAEADEIARGVAYLRQLEGLP